MELSPILQLFKQEGPDALEMLSEREKLTVKFLWDAWARPTQKMPEGDWRIALWCCGRGFGKTRTGSEAVRWMAESGKAGHITISSSTSADIRDICLEGESGLLNISPPWFFPVYEPSKRRLTWPNGARAVLVSADEPERFRGLQSDFAWCDELGAWRYPEAWDQLMFGLRLGSNPRCIVTTTPRPSTIIKNLIAREDDDVVIIRGTSFDNQDNLPPAFFNSILERYEGTRLYRQEVNAEILEDVPGAIVEQEMIEKARTHQDDLPQMTRTIVAVDPAVTSGDKSDETGIIVAGLGEDGDVYILEDRSCRESPEGWARIAVGCYERHEADKILGEVNNGGDLVRATLRSVSKEIPFKAIRASRGKHLRFEPVGSLFEQGRVHMVGTFSQLEDQVIMFTPGGYEGGDSPDRADAMVYAVTELLLDPHPAAVVWSV